MKKRARMVLLITDASDGCPIKRWSC